MIDELRATIMASEGLDAETVGRLIDDSVRERVPDALRVSDVMPGNEQDRFYYDADTRRLIEDGMHLNLWAASYLINIDSMRSGT